MTESKVIASACVDGYGHSFLEEPFINNLNIINNADMLKEETITQIMVIFKDADYEMLARLSQDKLDYILKNALEGRYKTFLNAINDEQCEINSLTIEDLKMFETTIESKIKSNKKSWNKNKFWE